jgi:hypothetical protein
MPAKLLIISAQILRRWLVAQCRLFGLISFPDVIHVGRASRLKIIVQREWPEKVRILIFAHALFVSCPQSTP